jgi:hypothetical protein
MSIAVAAARFDQQVQFVHGDGNQITCNAFRNGRFFLRRFRPLP